MNSLPPVKTYDAIVVGLGPAGSTTAYELSRAGLSVLGLEKQVLPRHKACGGGLSARVDSVLDQDFKGVVEQTIHGVRFAYPGEEALLIESSAPIAYMVQRARFDHLLAEKAHRAGTEVHEDEPVLAFVELENGVEVLTQHGRYQAQFIIGADGANSRVAQHFFPQRRFPLRPSLESEIDMTNGSSYPAEDEVLIDLGATTKGYAWIFPKQDGLSVGVAEFRGRVKSPKESFKRFIHGDNLLAGISIPPPYGHPLPLYPYGHRGVDHSLVAGQALLVGDAAHLVDPLFGEGIYYAIRSGQLAAASILATFHDSRRSLFEYQHAIRDELYVEFRIASRLARILYTFPRVCHRLVRRYQDVIQLYYGVLQGTETYHTFFLKTRKAVQVALREFLKKPFAATY